VTAPPRTVPHPDAVRAALALARGGTVVDLSTPISMDAPRMAGMSPYAICWWQHPLSSRRALEQAGARNGAAFADERIEMDLHTGTHIDALGHAWAAGAGFGGIAVEDAVGAHGLTRLGVEEVPPLIARGVLLDVAATCGRELRGGEVVTTADLQRAADARDCALNAGDIVLIRTGWGRHYAADPERYAASWPGIGIEAARWLTSHDVLAVGADNIALEVYPEERADACAPVHLHMLAGTGTYIIEQANLEELATMRPTSFLCLCLPSRFVGATASPIRLTAVL
jgi:kynurenine formamidase